MSDARQVPRATTDSGVPAPSDEHSLTAGPNGPTLLQHRYLVQKTQHFNRERVPERVVHAKGSGAHRCLEVTEDLRQWTHDSALRPSISPTRSYMTRSTPHITVLTSPNAAFQARCMI